MLEKMTVKQLQGQVKEKTLGSGGGAWGSGPRNPDVLAKTRSLGWSACFLGGEAKMSTLAPGHQVQLGTGSQAFSPAPQLACARDPVGQTGPVRSGLGQYQVLTHGPRLGEAAPAPFAGLTALSLVCIQVASAAWTSRAQSPISHQGSQAIEPRPCLQGPPCPAPPPALG